MLHHILFERRLKMDLSKLKLGKMTKINALNFPPELKLGVTASKTPEVRIAYTAFTCAGQAWFGWIDA
jgi:hypothetical protein